MKDCECNDWKKNIPKLNGILQMAQLRDGRGYTGKFFEYCPWCGKKGEPKKEIKGDYWLCAECDKAHLNERPFHKYDDSFCNEECAEEWVAQWGED